MQTLVFPFIFLFLALFVSCSASSSALSRLPALGNAETYISEEVVFAKDIFNLKNKKEIYAKNLFVGDLNFSGGISREKTPWGEQVVTKQVDFLNEAGVQEETLNYVQSIATKKFKTYKSAKIGQLTKMFQIGFQKDLTKVADEGVDNINIPNEILDFKIQSNFDFKGKQGILLVPIVQYSYSHNAGWFNGQDWGCMAGVRAKLLLVWIQMETKTVLHVEGLEAKQKEYQNSRYNYLDRSRNFQKIWKEIEAQI